ncbi:hypothetical protein C8D87_12118 [Lentzea atacamensis]|uniref:Uncharacterized protein n=1 Tax=Lentzea atacamensis TaxID=531938 RepID=A0ABX9DWJ6_9PSEU|nr:hypothetical protein [Lentzea atacamensis]RAS57835.1 hypothetical protein C8D87_12118 [Lentzea atacamensis]
MPDLLTMSLNDLLTPTNPDAPAGAHSYLDIPDITGHEDLIDVHRKLLDQADRYPALREAATLVHSASSALAVATTDRARDQVNVVFHAIIVDLRGPAGSKLDEMNRFNKTRSELEHLYMISRADRANAAHATP